jgi:hypothetical protein
MMPLTFAVPASVGAGKVPDRSPPAAPFGGSAAGIRASMMVWTFAVEASSGFG